MAILLETEAPMVILLETELSKYKRSINGNTIRDRLLSFERSKKLYCANKTKSHICLYD